MVTLCSLQSHSYCMATLHVSVAIVVTLYYRDHVLKRYIAVTVVPYYSVGMQ